MKKVALKAMVVLAIVIALCMFFSGTVRTITTPRVRFLSAKQGKGYEFVTADPPDDIIISHAGLQSSCNGL